MKVQKSKNRVKDIKKWEEESGLLEFLSALNAGIKQFDEDYGFGIDEFITQVNDIDGDTKLPHKAEFILERYNSLLPEMTYCLYAVLKNRALYGYIGLYTAGSITTLKELSPLEDFRNGQEVLFTWLMQLVRASFEKTVL